MSRARMLHPGFFENEDLAECSLAARLCFAGLWTLADREGRLEDRPMRIKGKLFAFDSFGVEPLLAELASQGFIRRYVVAGRALIQIVEFHKHQNPHYREAASKLPPPPSLAHKPEAHPPFIDGRASPLNGDEARGPPGFIEPEARGSPPDDDAMIEAEASGKPPDERGSSLPDQGGSSLPDETGVSLPDEGGSSRAVFGMRYSDIRNTVKEEARASSARETSDPKPEASTPMQTTPGEACKAMKQAGIAEVNPSNPTLRAMCEQGATAAEFHFAALKAVDHGKGFAYALACVKGDREAAAKVSLAPAAPNSGIARFMRPAGAPSVLPPDLPDLDLEETGAHHGDDARARG